MNGYKNSEQEEMLVMMEQMQDEIEQLRSDLKAAQETISDQQRTISTHSLQVSKLKGKISDLLKDNQSLQQSNEDLRNKNGLQSRKEQKDILTTLDNLNKENRKLTSLVNMSNVHTVQQEKERRHKAEIEMDRAKCDADKAIKKAQDKADEREMALSKYEERLRKRDQIYCGLLVVVLLISAFFHTEFFADAKEFFEMPVDGLSAMWFSCLKFDPNGSEIERWLILILVPVLLIGGLLALSYLVVRLRLRWNILTISFCVVDLALCIYAGSLLPFNSIYALLGFAVAYLLFCSWADKRWDSYEDKEHWERFQRELVW